MKNSPYPWQTALDEAIREFNLERLAARLAEVDDAVFYRLMQIEGTTGNEGERLALEDAMQDVRLLRNHALRFTV